MLKKLFLLLLTVSCSVLTVNAQIQFRLSIGTNGGGGNAIVQTTDGGYTIAGVTRSFGAGGLDFYIVKLDGSGILQWTKTVGGTSDESASSMVKTTDGGYVVAGRTQSFGAGYFDMFIVKLSSSGTVQWSKTVGGTAYEDGPSIIQTSDGGYAVAGQTTSFGAGQSDMYIVKLDANGNLQWSKTAGSTSYDAGYSIVQTSDGGYAVGGSTYFGAGRSDFYIVKLDASGNLQWSKSMGGANDDVCYSIIQTTDGGYAMAGVTLGSFGAGGEDAYIVRLNASGNLLWSRTVGGTANDIFECIIQTTDGGLVLAGHTKSFGAPNGDLYVVKLDLSGALQWSKIARETNGFGAANIIQTPDGGYATIGTGGPSSNIYIVKFDASVNTCGNTLSPSSITGSAGSFGSPTSIVISPASTVNSPAPSSGTGGTLTNICTVQPCSLTATITPNGPTTFCQGGSVTLTSNAASSYLWTPGGATTQSIVVSASGSYTVTITDANNCSATSSPTVVTVNSLPTADITPNGPTTFCQGESVMLTASSGSSYLWSPGNATTQSITISSSGSYTVTVTNASGCSATSSPTNVTVNSLPTATITPGGPTTFCQGGSVTLTASAGSSYLWSSSETTQSITVSASGSYSVTVTNANGCSATSSPTVVTVNSLPTATITAGGPTTFCQGGSVTLTSSAGASYLWSPGGATTQSITVSSSGSYSVTVTNANGCSATSSPTSVTVNSLPTATITAGGPTTFCQGGSVILTASAGSSYLWSNSETTQSITVSNSGSYSVTVTNASGCSATSSPTVVTINSLPTVTVSSNVSICSGSSTSLTASGANTYSWSPSTGLNTTTGATVIANPSTTTTYTVTGTNANGCSNIASVTVTVIPLPIVDAGQDQSIYSGCLTQSATLTANVSGGNGPFTYHWSPGGATTQSITVSPSGTTSYTVTATNNFGCSTSDQVVVNVTPVNINVDAGQDQSIYGGCVTQNATLTAGVSGGFGPYTYLWSPGGATTQSITVSPSSTTTYTVTATNTLGCSATDQVIVNVTPVSITVDAGQDQSIYSGCVTQNAALTVSVSGGFGPYTYLWSPGGATTQAITVSPSNTTTYTVTATNTLGCSSSDQVVVNVTPVSLGVNAGTDTTIYLGYGAQSVTLTASVSGGFGPYTYLWSPGGATTQSVTVSPTTTTTYTVQVTNSIGCSASDQVLVTVYDTRCGNNGNKILVCHNGVTICISRDALTTHLGHGDHLDSCNGGSDNRQGTTIKKIPEVYMLHFNYPNPFNPVTLINYDLPYDSKVTLKIYDITGSKIMTLVDGSISAGYYTAQFNGENFASGIYFYKLIAISGKKQFVKTMKMVLLK